MMSGCFHGSDLEEIERIYGVPKDEIISFAANVNPLGLPEDFSGRMAGEISCIERYPDREYTALRAAMGKYVNADPDMILVGNGSSELIGDVLRIREKPKALLLSPAYSEYERDLKLMDGDVEYFDLSEEDDFICNVSELISRLDAGYDLLVICNPLNPTSTAISRRDMEKVLDKCSGTGTICLVDETYIDFADECYDATPLCGKYECLFVIRSMSKFFCAPGLRLGYAVTSHRALRDRINERKDPWSVSSFAAVAGESLLCDEHFIKRSASYVREERDRVCRALDEMRGYGLKYYSPTANFVLCRLPEGDFDAHSLFEKAIRERMMIRDCSSFRGLDERYFRFCFMKREDDDRLLEMIREEVL